jgi:CDP-2,3-bis-(O-geranylgeranyl)-sn-glycerol synthase
MWLLSLLLFFTPAFAANAMPVVAAHIPGITAWDTPVHRGWFGAHKTWRGVVMGIVGALVVGLLQMIGRFALPSSAVAFLPDAPWKILLLSVLLGGGALAGDMVKSAFKRASGRPPGSRWFPWDGIDYVLGALLFASPIVILPLSGMMLLLFIGPFASAVANLFAYNIGLKSVGH